MKVLRFSDPIKIEKNKNEAHKPPQSGANTNETFTFFVDGVGVLVGLCSLHCQLPLHSRQNLAILIHDGVSDVRSFFKLWVSLVL